MLVASGQLTTRGRVECFSCVSDAHHSQASHPENCHQGLAPLPEFEPAKLLCSIAASETHLHVSLGSFTVRQCETELISRE